MPIDNKALIQDLKRDGIGYWTANLDPKKVFQLNQYLDNCEVCNTHVWAKADKKENIKFIKGNYNSWPVFSVHMDNIVLAPHFFELALQSYPIAKAYFEEVPRLYSMNVFWTQPGPYQYMDTHYWHIDGDDRKQLVLFMYGNDVYTPEEGAHLYRRGSHLQDQSGFPGGTNNLDVPNLEITIGKAGTCFFVDTKGLHMGIRPNKPRMLAWARWGVSKKPASYIWDQLQPVPKELLGDRYPTDPILQKAIELVVS